MGGVTTEPLCLILGVGSGHGPDPFHTLLVRVWSVLDPFGEAGHGDRDVP